MKPQETKKTEFHVTIDVIALTILDGFLNVAVVQRDHQNSCIDVKRNGKVLEVPRDFDNHWALPGGHVNSQTENLIDAAKRKIKEETSIEVNSENLVEIGAYGNLNRDPRSGRTVSIAYVTFQPMFATPSPGHHAKVAKFMPVLELLAEPNRLEFDHEEMLIDAIQKVRDLMLSTPVATSFCPQEFTMTELREVYEVLWHHAYDKEIDSHERLKYAAEVREYTVSDSYQLLSRAGDLKYEFALMPQAKLNKSTKILMSETKNDSTRRPVIKNRLDPANFSRKVENIPGFIEKIPDSTPRSSLSNSTGRPAQLFRRGKAERLDPPLRLRVKRAK